MFLRPFLAYTACYIFCLQATIAQVKTNPILKKDVPASIKYDGKIVQAVTWNDTEGKHYIILTETGSFYTTAHNSEGDGEGGIYPSEELFAYHYAETDDSSIRIWRVNDHIYNCAMDHAAKFCKGSLAITDLNQNNVPEITFMYKTGCAGDVGPLTLKLIMYEGRNKYALRGNTQVFIDGMKFDPSSYKVDISFTSAPSIFLDFAKNHWKKFDAYRYD